MSRSENGVISESSTSKTNGKSKSTTATSSSTSNDSSKKNNNTNKKRPLKKWKQQNGKDKNKNDNKDSSSKQKGSKVKKIKLLKRGISSIEFDPVARYEYLTGFQERKRTRRIYGLAQQKIKDRKNKLELRATKRNAEHDLIIEAEQMKQQQQKQHTQLQRLLQRDSNNGIDNDDIQSIGNESVSSYNTATSNNNNNNEQEQVLLFDGEETEQQWGGHVIVTTTTHIPGDSDDDDDSDMDNNNNNKKRKAATNHDTEQEYAGKIEKYIKVVKGNLPSKKRKTTNNISTSHHHNKKGQHGATQMKGIGTASDMKVAQKMLSRSTSTKKSIKGSRPNSGGKRKR